jgi:glycosyltransferase involved in cell wall biosynthesis
MVTPLHILQLTPRLPYPLTDGGAVGIYKITETLASIGHSITMVSYPDSKPEVTNAAYDAITRFARLELVSKPLPSMNSTLLKTIFRGAYPIERRMMPEMFGSLETLLSENKYDIVHIDHSHMGKYGLWIKKKYGLPIVLREHNYEHLIYRRFAENEKNPLKKFIASVHAQRLQREEDQFLKAFDVIVPITQEDERAMRQNVPDARYVMIPGGVDTEYFHPTDPTLVIPNSLLWVGGAHWLPNRDAIEFFVKQIYPLIVNAQPEVTVDIVGDGTRELRSLTNDPRIRFHGRVDDIRPYLARAAVLICPIRVGGGMRLKLLDFFAAGKAVVSTHIGAEGNLAQDNEHILLRDEPNAFAEAVCGLLTDNMRREDLSVNARDLAETYYSWRSIGMKFTQVYRSLIVEQ